MRLPLGEQQCVARGGEQQDARRRRRGGSASTRVGGVGSPGWRAQVGHRLHASCNGPSSAPGCSNQSKMTLPAHRMQAGCASEKCRVLYSASRSRLGRTINNPQSARKVFECVLAGFDDGAGATRARPSRRSAIFLLSQGPFDQRRCQQVGPVQISDCGSLFPATVTSRPRGSPTHTHLSIKGSRHGGRG